MSATPGSERGQLARVDPPIRPFTFGGVVGEFGLHGTQQPDFGGDLRSQIGERDRWMTVVELDGCFGCCDPFDRPVMALMVVATPSTITAVTRFNPALSSRFGSRIVPAWRDRRHRDHRSTGSSGTAGGPGP